MHNTLYNNNNTIHTITYSNIRLATASAEEQAAPQPAAVALDGLPRARRVGLGDVAHVRDPLEPQPRAPAPGARGSEQLLLLEADADPPGLWTGARGELIAQPVANDLLLPNDGTGGQPLGELCRLQLPSRSNQDAALVGTTHDFPALASIIYIYIYIYTCAYKYIYIYI